MDFPLLDYRHLLSIGREPRDFLPASPQGSEFHQRQVAIAMRGKGFGNNLSYPPWKLSWLGGWHSLWSILRWVSVPQTNSHFASENGRFSAPKGNESSSNHQSLGRLTLVSGRVSRVDFFPDVCSLRGKFRWISKNLNSSLLSKEILEPASNMTRYVSFCWFVDVSIGFSACCVSRSIDMFDWWSPPGGDDCILGWVVRSKIEFHWPKRCSHLCTRPATQFWDLNKIPDLQRSFMLSRNRYSRVHRHGFWSTNLIQRLGALFVFFFGWGTKK